MKAEILQILQMQKDGKLTQDQAAELLAMLADPAREKDRSTERQGAQGPQAAAREAGGGMSSAAAATLHSLVDTAVSVGATVGRAATVWGGELVGMVHREESGNTLTLSKVEPPAGDGYTFKSNAFNVSKVSRLTLNGSEFANNTVNASDLSHVTLTRGRLSQCNFASSSVSRVTVEGPPAPGGGDLTAKDDHAVSDVDVDAELDGARVFGETILDPRRETVRRVLRGHTPLPSRVIVPSARWHSQAGSALGLRKAS